MDKHILYRRVGSHIISQSKPHIALAFMRSAKGAMGGEIESLQDLHLYLGMVVLNAGKPRVRIKAGRSAA